MIKKFLDTLISILMVILLFVGIVVMVYIMGSQIMTDYYKHGALSIVLSFVLGGLFMTLFFFLAGKYYYKTRKK